MAEESIDATVIKTQEILGKYVKKPVLSEKLLKKPPFRFLYDIFNALIKNTGCFEGLYTPDELNYENINDRDAKMQFLQKIIDVIKIATNEPLTVRTSKIVAGQEPEKTNQLLQLIGTVIENKLDWKAAVEKVCNGNASPNPKSKPKEKDVREKKIIEKPSPKVAGIKKTDSSKPETKEKTKSKEVKEKTLKKSSKPTDGDKKDEKRTKIKVSSKDQIKKTSPDKVKKSSSKLEHESKSELKSKPDDIKKPKSEPNTDKETATKDDESVLNDIKNETYADISPETSSPSNQFKRNERRASKRAEEILLAAAAEDTNSTESRRSSGGKRSSARSRKSSAETSRSGKSEDVKIPAEPIESLKSVAEEPLPVDVPSSVVNSLSSQNPLQNVDIQRESTFVRENSKETTQNPPRPRTSLRPPSARPASARPGAPRRRDKNVEIILQPSDQVKLSTINVKLETFNSELEDDGENLVIIENPNTEDPLPGIAGSDNRIEADETLQQGHLVQQILETQKELVHGGSSETESKVDKENDISKLNSRQSSARQMNSLRDVIQNLTKSVNPLGKLMDFIPEDIDAMQLELTMWRDTYNQSSVELKKERSLTESVTEPMKNQLVTIESTIKEYREMIDACRVKILTNAEKIQRLLTTQ